MNLKQIQQDFANNIIVSRETLVKAIDYAVELEYRLPDYEAVAWAYKNLLTIYGGRQDLQTALMLDRLNFMLMESQ
jgi:hypothetical protein